MEGIMAEVYRHEISAVRNRIKEELVTLDDTKAQLKELQKDSRNFTTSQDVKLQKVVDTLQKAIAQLNETQ
jgi:hypothetical protein